MKNRLQIQKLRPADWQIYKQIHLEALKNDPQAFGASYEEWKNHSDMKWQERPNNPDTILMIAKDGKNPIGLVGCLIKDKDNEKIGYIWGMYVNKEYRGKGIGKKLLEKLLTEMWLKDAKKTSLMVEFHPTPAQSLYRSLGFETTGTTDWVLGDGKKHKLYVMEKSL